MPIRTHRAFFLRPNHENFKVNDWWSVILTIMEMFAGNRCVVKSACPTTAGDLVDASKYVVDTELSRLLPETLVGPLNEYVKAHVEEGPRVLPRHRVPQKITDSTDELLHAILDLPLSTEDIADGS
jgi:hypothetical protein